MSTIRADFRDQFRAPAYVKYYHKLPESMIEPGYVYRRIARSYKYDPHRIDRALKIGWDFVLEKGTEISDVSNGTKSKENVRPTPMEIISKDGTVSYWMRIPTEVLEKHNKQKMLERHARTNRSVTKKKTPKGTRISDNDVYDPNDNF